MSLTVKIRGDATQFEKTMRGVNRTVSGLGTKIAGLGASAVAAAGAYASLSAAFGALQTASNKAADMEALTLQLTTLTGSAEKAKDMIALFVKEEQKSSLNLEDYSKAASLMLAFGVAQDDLIPIMKMIADVSLGNSDRFQGLARAYGQAASNGRLLTEEVNQMAERGFNPLMLVAERTGEEMINLRKRVSDNKVTIQELKQAFIDATSKGGKFYKGIENGSSSMQAKLAQAQGAVTQLQVAFGTGMNEGIKSALDATTNSLPQFREKFTEAGEQVGSAITEAVNGDLQRFADIGQLVGEVISQALKATIIAGLDQLGEEIGQFLSFGAKSYTDTSSTANQATMGLAGMIADATKSQTNIKTEMDRVSPAIQDSIRMFQLKNEASQYYGFSENMSEELKRAIRDGMIEAERYYSRGAKFSN